MDRLTTRAVVWGSGAGVVMGAVTAALINELDGGWPWWLAAGAAVAGSAALTMWLTGQGPRPARAARFPRSTPPREGRPDWRLAAYDESIRLGQELIARAPALTDRQLADALADWVADAANCVRLLPGGDDVFARSFEQHLDVRQELELLRAKNPDGRRFFVLTVEKSINGLHVWRPAMETLAGRPASWRERPEPYDVFVSYAPDDRDFAASLVAALGRYQLAVWVDGTEIKIGDSLRAGSR